ncbi:DUF397 domain-containing protein [Streptomyces sp. NPDC048172]|uniref:DUF397 domain-containing protein n=1 Tax=Streptomyces sp. NPDC048172 TaxID=3365505 RepID=UPI00371CD737
MAGTPLVAPRWVKSSYSGGAGSECVEVTSGFPGVVAVRDSKAPEGPRVRVTPDAWAAFTRHVRRNG